MKRRDHTQAPPQLVTSHCEELDLWSKQVGWEADYRQVGRGAFEAWFDTSVTPGFRAVEQYCSREMVISGSPPPDHVPLLMVLNQGDRGRFLGKDLESGQNVMMCPGSEGTYRAPQGLHMVTVSISRQRLMKAHEVAGGGEDLSPLIRETRALAIPASVSRELLSLARDCIYHFDPTGERGIAHAETEQRFTALFLSQLTGRDHGRSEVLDRKGRARYVLTARDHIESNLDQALGLEVLAGVIGVSPRTLEYAFRESFDTTVVRYIKTRRLHAARRALELARPGQGSVTVGKIAHRFGFSHLGYFSRDYRQLFAELPSETLERMSHGREA